MSRRLFLLLFVSIILFPAITSSQSQAEKKKALYFYGQDCSHCEKVDEYFRRENMYGRYEIRKIDVSGPYNFEYLGQFFDTFGIKQEKRGWPAVFFGQEVLVGDQPIIENFAREIEAGGTFEFPQLDRARYPLKDSQKMPLLIVLGAALVDAINPCAIAVLLLLVTSVISASGKREGLFSGILFSSAIFIAYSFIGFATYFILEAWKISTALSVLVGIMALLIGMAHIKDFIWYGKMFTTEIPFSWRPKMQNILRGIHKSTGAFGAGFLMSIFLLPCSGGPYLVVIGLLAERESVSESIWYILFYNAIFVLPLLVVTLAIYAGVRTGRLEVLRKKHTRLLHGAVGGIMIFIGGYILVSIV